MDENFGIKELYDVSLRCTSPMTINGRDYSENEAILKFKKIQLAPLVENKSRRRAAGGYNNAHLVSWENTSSVSFMLSQGVISKVGLAILSNSQLSNTKKGKEIPVPFSQYLETDDTGKAVLKYSPIEDDTFFLYDAKTGARIMDYSLEGNILKLEKEPYKEICVDYTFSYTNGANTLEIGKRLVDGYLKLDGKMRLKDDFDGHTKTGILEIPRVELMSDLSMRLGSEVDPYVYQFQIAGLPVGGRENQHVCKIIMLDNEIDSDL